MRTGFLARTGLALGPLAASFGYGGGLDSALDRVALVLLSDAAMTEILASLDVTGNGDVAELVVIAVADEPATDVRLSHERMTVIELEDEA